MRPIGLICAGATKPSPAGGSELCRIRQSPPLACGMMNSQQDRSKDKMDKQLIKESELQGYVVAQLLKGGR